MMGTAMAAPETLATTDVNRFDADLFRSAMAEMPAAVTVITGLDEAGRPLGATLSSVSSLSLDPPLMLACFKRTSKTFAAVAEVGRPFLIHILAQGQEALAGIFAGKAEDKFARVTWRMGESGLPELPDCAGRVHCTVDALVPGGDHVIVTGAVAAIEHDVDRMPLLYHRREIYPVPRRSEAPR